MVGMGSNLIFGFSKFHEVTKFGRFLKLRGEESGGVDFFFIREIFYFGI